MPGGKSKIINRYVGNIYRCKYCDYVAKGEKARELHAKYSHGKENGGKSVCRRGIVCSYCSKSWKNCSCVSSAPRL